MLCSMSCFPLTGVESLEARTRRIYKYRDSYSVWVSQIRQQELDREKKQQLKKQAAKLEKGENPSPDKAAKE